MTTDVTNPQTDLIVEFSGLLPEVFTDNRASHSESDIWLRDRVAIARGERILLRAASGSGKTSLCTFITGKRSDYLGHILLDGKDIRQFSPDDWARIRCRTIAWLPQEIGLFPALTALENIELKNALTNTYTRDEIMEMLAAVEMAGFAGRPAGKLSWGQQQRVGLVRALCQPFSLLLLDEPVSHLDSKGAEMAAALAGKVASERNAAVIVTSVGTDLNLPVQRILNL